MITAKDLAGAIALCGEHAHYMDDSDPELKAVCIDGWYNLERAAKLLNRLERMRARRRVRFDGSNDALSTKAGLPDGPWTGVAIVPRRRG